MTKDPQPLAVSIKFPPFWLYISDVEGLVVKRTMKLSGQTERAAWRYLPPSHGYTSIDFAYPFSNLLKV